MKSEIYKMLELFLENSSSVSFMQGGADQFSINVPEWNCTLLMESKDFKGIDFLIRYTKDNKVVNASSAYFVSQWQELKPLLVEITKRHQNNFNKFAVDKYREQIDNSLGEFNVEVFKKVLKEEELPEGYYIKQDNNTTALMGKDNKVICYYDKNQINNHLPTNILGFIIKSFNVKTHENGEISLNFLLPGCELEEYTLLNKSKNKIIASFKDWIKENANLTQDELQPLNRIFSNYLLNEELTQKNDNIKKPKL